MNFLQRFLLALRRRKPIIDLLRERNSASSSSLKKCLTASDLILYGVGSSVGAGIYSLIGVGAKEAGAGISLSFLFCGLACIFTSLAYSEFAARVPIAGSAYTFVYASFGEFAAWLVGWNLTLGYGVSSAVVARSWAQCVPPPLLDLLPRPFALPPPPPRAGTWPPSWATAAASCPAG
jgi:amino acid transporter